MEFVRTTVHADRICQHLMQPLYIVKHFAAVNEERGDMIWAQLLDTYGQLSDMESLALLKQSIVKKREKDVGNFDSALARLYTG